MTFNLGVSSLQHVFDSLTDNGKGVLKLIIKEQIEQIRQRKEGPNFKGMLKIERKTPLFGKNRFLFKPDLYSLFQSSTVFVVKISL